MNSTSDVIWFDYSDQRPAFNLAIDEAIMRHYNIIGAPIFRLWETEGMVNIGRYQSPYYDINFDYCLKNNIPICKRITGGSTFYQDSGAINFVFFASTEKELWKLFHTTIFETISSFSSDIVLKGPNMLFKNKKFGSLGLYFGKESFMLQGTIFYSVDLDKYARILNLDSYDLKKEIMNLGEISNMPITVIKQLLVDYTHLSFSKLPELLKNAELYFSKRYNTELWTFGKNNLAYWKRFKSSQNNRTITIALETEEERINSIQFFCDVEVWDRKFISTVENSLKGELLTKISLINRFQDFNTEKLKNNFFMEIEDIIDNILIVQK